VDMATIGYFKDLKVTKKPLKVKQTQRENKGSI